MQSSPVLAPMAAGGGGASARSEHIVHVLPSFGIGGVPLRMVRVINHLGPHRRHTVIALDGDFGAAAGLAENVEVALAPAAVPRRGTLRGVLEGALALRRLRPDLLATYNWGAIEWAMANRLFPVSPQLHFEAGFGKEEADAQMRRRVLFRRWALARRAKVVVPSQRLLQLAREVWKVPASRVVYIPNGVNIERFCAPERNRASGFNRRPGELVIGTVAPLRPEKNVGRLLRAVAALDGALGARLVVAGDGPERPSLESLARHLGLGERVVFTGQVAPESVLAGFDVFALSSDTEQMPNALLEAMAAGRAVAAVDVGDVKSIVCEENREFIVPRDDARAFCAALEGLLHAPAKRRLLGDKNRERAAAQFSEARMFGAYAALFGVDPGPAKERAQS
ncbi:MAG TPA: glycosyltransferase family 4 protein [Stellaceae bacterium]|jgi:glycosyltransferase involved in cell wall biosynthesis